MLLTDEDRALLLKVSSLLEELIETLEVLGEEKTLKAIKEAEDDVKAGRVREFYRGKQFSIMTETNEWSFGKPPKGYMIKRYICQDCREQLLGLLKSR